MENQEMLNMIANADLSEEQRNALLKELANKIIREQNTPVEEKTWEEKNEETIKKANENSAALKERVEGYKERDRKQQEEKMRNAEIEEKAQILEELKNKNGEKVYNDTQKMSGYQIEADYKVYEGTKELEEAKKTYEQKNSPEKVSEDLTTDENVSGIVSADLTSDEFISTTEDIMSAPKKEGFGRKIVKSISSALEKIRQGMEKNKQTAYDETKIGNNEQNYAQDNVRIRN